MRDNEIKKEKASDSEIIIYSAIGGFLILKMMPVYIPYVICYAGLMISFYGIMDIINKSQSRRNFDVDIKDYIENSNK